MSKREKKELALHKETLRRLQLKTAVRAGNEAAPTKGRLCPNTTNHPACFTTACG